MEQLSGETTSAHADTVSKDLSQLYADVLSGKEQPKKTGESDMESLTVHVLDDDQNPVRWKKVYCKFVGSHFGLSDTLDNVRVCTRSDFECSRMSQRGIYGKTDGAP